MAFQSATRIEVSSNDQYPDYGRPLSIIESRHSSSSAEEDEVAKDLMGVGASHFDMHSNDRSDEKESGDPHDYGKRPKVGEKLIADNLEAQIFSLFNQKTPSNADGDSFMNSDGKVKSIRIKDLPRLLSDYEKNTGAYLLDAELHGQVNVFAQSNPELRLQAEEFLAMIQQLHAAREADLGPESNADQQDMFSSTNAAADDSQEIANGRRSQASEGRASDESSFDTSSSEGHDFDEDVRDGENAIEYLDDEGAGQRGDVDFPRSQSEQVGSCDDGLKLRKKTSSDPTAPVPNHRRASAPAGGVQRVARSRQRTESTGDREVLKGKGKVKAPPSAWSRPKPQALINRDRNRKISESSTASGSFDGDYEMSGSSSPTSRSYSHSKSPQQHEQDTATGFLPRQRLSSQPALASPTESGSQIPRSVSSASQGFVFPRAASPSSNDFYDVAASERWNALYDRHPGAELTESVSSPLLGDSAYPGLRSPAYRGEEFIKRRSLGSRHSSGTGRHAEDQIGDETIMGDERLSALQAQLESTQRLLAEKNKSIEQMQRESEEYITRLQDEIESVKGDLSLRRKEDALNRVRENVHLDNIVSLEGDLNKATSELETLRAQHARLRIDHDELVVAMERHTARSYEYREQIEKAKNDAQEFAEQEKQWERDRESYRETIKSLNTDIGDLQQKLVGRDDDVRLVASLQANIDALNAELEEVRNRGQSVLHGNRLGSEADATLSKRLGSELARSIAVRQSADDEVQDEEEEEDAGNDAADVSHDSMIVTTIRRRRRNHAGSSRAVEMQEVGTQTLMKDAETGDESVAPPTYDEARLEKELIARQHPTWSGTHALGNSDLARQYESVALRLGSRCTHLEGQLRQAIVKDPEESVSARWIKSVRKVMADPSSMKDELSLLLQRDRFIVEALVAFLAGMLLTSIITAVWGDRLGGKAYSEDARAWEMSNTLQVPWDTLDRQSSWLASLFGRGQHVAAGMTPT